MVVGWWSGDRDGDGDGRNNCNGAWTIERALNNALALPYAL